MAIALLRTPSSYSPPSATAPLLPFTTACRSPSRVPSSAGHWKRVRGLRIKSGSGRGLALTLADTSGDLKEIRDCCTIWKWKEFDVNYLVKGKGPPLLLVHGFGASVGHWRRSEAEKTMILFDILPFVNHASSCTRLCFLAADLAPSLSFLQLKHLNTLECMKCYLDDENFPPMLYRKLVYLLIIDQFARTLEWKM